MFKGDYMLPPSNRVFNQYRKSGGGSDVILSMKKSCYMQLHGAHAIRMVTSRIQNFQRLGRLSLTVEYWPKNLDFNFNAYKKWQPKAQLAPCAL